MSQQAFDFEEAHYLNYNGGHFFYPKNNVPNYYYLGWRTYEDFSYGNSSFQSQEGLSSNYEEQKRQSSFEDQTLALLDEIKKSNEMRLSNLEVNQANTNATLRNLETQIRDLTLALEEESSRPLPSDIEDDGIVTLSFEEELLGPALVEKKDDELVIEEEPLLDKMQVEEQHPGITIENVLVGVGKFNFLIDFFLLWAWKMTDKSHL